MAVWFITGCSSGFGEGLAKDALAHGDKVIATGRKLEKLQGLKELGATILQLDVTDSLEAIQKVAKEAWSVHGRIDHLVNNAGLVVLGFIEELSEELVHLQWDTNYFGVLKVTKAFLPYFREQKSGLISAISSESSGLYEPRLGQYCASKAALDMYINGLRQELAPFGIKAMTIHPGEYFTAIESNIVATKPDEMILDYQNAFGSEDTRLTVKRPGEGEAAAKRIYEVLTQTGVAKGRGLPDKFYLGADAVYHTTKLLKQRLAELQAYGDLGKGEGQAGLPTYATDEP